MKHFVAFRRVTICVLTWLMPLSGQPLVGQTDDQRLSESTVYAGLELLYLFKEENGDRVRDASGTRTPLNLIIEGSAGSTPRQDMLEFKGTSIARAENGSHRVNAALRRTGEISLEVWLTPVDLKLTGPARIVTLSRNSSERNLTFGQDEDIFEVRLRTTKTSNNGIPAMRSRPNSVQKKLTHFVYTRERSGRTRIYIDGQLQAEQHIAGDLSNWDLSQEFALGNELTIDRPWQGKLHRVALYSRALSPREVSTGFQSGPEASLSQSAALAAESVKEEFFDTKVAGLLAKRCFECHDAATQAGGLDLSRKITVSKGGESGPPLVAGKHAESLLWQSVATNKMPHKRSPLAEGEKATLAKWIDDGAVWSLDQIDAAVYAHDTEVATTWVRRLTVREYIATVQATVGVDISQEARELLPPDLRADGFTNTAYNLAVDLKHISAYAQLAEMIVERMDVTEFAGQFTKKKRLIDDDMRELAAKMGHWILRGPLTEEEIVIYRGISTSVASAGGDYEEAVKLTIQAMLQSPRFLYRIENQRGDGSQLSTNNYELASRMSYLIWGASPDQELLQLAEAGNLFDPTILKLQVERMLKDPRAIEQSVRFLDEWLNLNRLDNLRPARDQFPNWTPSVASDMREETRAFFRYVVWEENRPLVELLNTETTFLTPALARHYGLDLELENGLNQVSLQEIPSRGGLLTHGSILTVGGDDASMVSRGLFVLHDLLRGTVNDPPPCVDTTPKATQQGLTQRGIAMERLANKTCGGCHNKFEPLAFGLEKFDGLGTYHEVDEHGNLLRDDGEILFPGEEQAIPYQNSAELMDLLANSKRVSECVTWKVTQFAMGRPLVAADVSIVQQIHKHSQANGGTWPSLIHAIIQSDLVQTIRTEPIE